MNIRAVLLDAGGTLFAERLTRDELYAQALAAHGLRVPAERLAGLREETEAGMPEVFAGHRRYTDGWFAEYLRRLLTRLDSQLPPERLRAELATVFSRPETYAVHADVPDTLERLGAAGLRLAVASNWSDRLTGILGGLDLLRHFEVVAASAEVGASKPDPELFRWVLRRLGLPPEHALHVGDHPLKDVAGARRAGVRALLLDREAPRADEDRLTSLEQLPARIGRLRAGAG